jgi:hypothetical protein
MPQGGPWSHIRKKLLKAITPLLTDLYASPTIAELGQVYDPTMCMAIDVFGGTIYRAKGEQRQVWKTVGTSCEEVTDRWPSVKPPANYNGPALPKP